MEIIISISFKKVHVWKHAQTQINLESLNIVWIKMKTRLYNITWIS